VKPAADILLKFVSYLLSSAAAIAKKTACASPREVLADLMKMKRYLFRDALRGLFLHLQAGLGASCALAQLDHAVPCHAPQHARFGAGT